MFKQDKRIRNHQKIHFEGNSIVASKSDIKEALKEYGSSISSVKMNGKVYLFGVDFDDIYQKSGKTVLAYAGSVVDAK